MHSGTNKPDEHSHSFQPMSDMYDVLLCDDKASAQRAWRFIKAKYQDQPLLISFAIDRIYKDIEDASFDHVNKIAGTSANNTLWAIYLSDFILNCARGCESALPLVELGPASQAKLMAVCTWLDDIRVSNFVCSTICGNFADFEEQAALILGAEGHAPWWLRYDAWEESETCLKTSVIPWVESTRDSRSAELFKSIKYFVVSHYSRNRCWPTIGDTIAWWHSERAHLARPNISISTHQNCNRILSVYPKFLLGIEWLSIQNPARLDHLLSERKSETLILEQLEDSSPRCAMITELAYPMGGGEAFMKQTALITRLIGIHTDWYSFYSAGAGAHRREILVETPYFSIVHKTGSLDYASVASILSSGIHDFVHSQGASNIIVAEAASQLGVAAICGFHYWTGLVKLPKSGNRQIMRNKRELKLNAEGSYRRSKNVFRYVVSEFMVDVYRAAGGIEDLRIVYPISDHSHFKTEIPPIEQRRSVLQLNIQPGKGGELFASLVKALPNIDFIAVSAEPGSDNLASELGELSNCTILPYANIKNLLKLARIVIVPSLVDETFGRVAYEAAASGIAVVSSRNGYLPYMLKENGSFVDDDADQWRERIKELMDAPEAVQQIAERQKREVARLTAQHPNQILQLCSEAIEASSRKNVALFGPWADQGLGIQLRQYAKDLSVKGFKVHVFSFQPYPARDRSLTWQENAQEWDTEGLCESIYYSFNDRENVTDYEFRQFLRANRVSTVVVPEICWTPNWNRLLNLPDHVRVFSVPNTETIVASEINLHSRIYLNLAPTRLCEKIFAQAGITNCEFIGYGYGVEKSTDNVAAKKSAILNSKKVKFLHVAGHNPISRKNTLKVFEAFQAARILRSDIELHVTISNSGLFELNLDKSLDGVVVHAGSLSHQDIDRLYEECHASIQVSSHEGIGIGFYESIAHSVPVISIDAEPHKEVVRPGISGWLMPSRPKRLPDNPDPVVCGWDFDAEDLENLLLSISRDDIASLVQTTAELHRSEYTHDYPAARLASALQRHSRASNIQREPRRFVRLRFRSLEESFHLSGAHRGASAIHFVDKTDDTVGRHRMWGPYVALPPGYYTGTIEFAPHSKIHGKVKIDITALYGKTELANAEVFSSQKTVRVPFKCDVHTAGIEIRLHSIGRIDLSIISIMIDGYSTG